MSGLVGGDNDEVRRGLTEEERDGIVAFAKMIPEEKISADKPKDDEPPHGELSGAQKQAIIESMRTAPERLRAQAKAEAEIVKVPFVCPNCRSTEYEVETKEREFSLLDLQSGILPKKIIIGYYCKECTAVFKDPAKYSLC